MTEYKFGPGKGKFSGTDDEWNKLRHTVIRVKHKKTFKDCKYFDVYPFVTIICPHCGSTNTHICDGTFSHRECHQIPYSKNYDCPGYYIYTPK